ncbi:MAG: hypothetical protein KKE76_10960 [Gammaproteobacteria bacterium]|nr:hypothetical protein [Gammaproteobacteria bacterium]
MKIQLGIIKYLLAFTLLVLTSCGGGSGGTLAEGGIGGSGISNGPITAFGSIFVNSVEYNTQSATVFVEGDNVGIGDAAVLNNLAVGKVVTVEGAIPDGGQSVATRVYFNDNVEGPLQNINVIDANTRELTVLGQTVIATLNTQFVNTTLTTLAVNNQLEISGLVTANGAIQATFIEKKLDTFVSGGTVEVKGVVSNLNTSAQTFNIAAMVVNYTGADMSELATPLANGNSVEIKGSFSGGVLQASRIETEDDLYISDSTLWLEIEGLVSSILSSTDFVLNNVQTVRTSASTEYEGGTVADVVAGARLEVEGTLSNGILLASEINFRDEVAIEAKVDTVGTSSLTLKSIPGLTVTANSLTEVDGAANSFSAITSGRFVHILGNWSSNSNTVIATKIEVENPSSTIEVKVRGALTSASNPFITLLGTSIDTTGVSYRSTTGTSLSAAQFFAQVAPGTLLYLEGVQNNASNILSWNRVSLRAP